VSPSTCRVIVASSPAGRVAPCVDVVVAAASDVLDGGASEVVEVEVEPSAEALEVEEVAGVSELLAEHPAAIEARTRAEQIMELTRLP